MATPELALLDVPDVLLLIFAWPRLPPAVRRGDYYDLVSAWSLAAAVAVEETQRWYPALVNAAIVRMDGTIDPDVRTLLERRADATLGKSDPEKLIIEYLSKMSLEARLTWLGEHGLLEDDSDDDDNGVM